ncbi:hypothetical protein KQI89_14955 [Clostridium sp. MSJ-4]|uniref:Uncharacterized protein n=1 Tax=Clostridium simiarum TaxID=2841506 RepID=A0ABS6F624_9CLOT|nr:hypothetical protein [Clostridium simiarum]MBU5593048.1 hypothetical protein [Clostridium simiarum]
MKRGINILLGALLFWFTLDITGFSLGSFCLVESPGILSGDTVWWIIFVCCFILFFLKEKQGKYVLSVFLTAWIIIQYFSHWNYTIFGVTERKLTGYNKYFANTFHIIPPSDSVLIPDLYHIILHILIISLFVLIIVDIFQKRKTDF